MDGGKNEKKKIRTVFLEENLDLTPKYLAKVGELAYGRKVSRNKSYKSKSGIATQFSNGRVPPEVKIDGWRLERFVQKAVKVVIRLFNYNF